MATHREAVSGIDAGSRLCGKRCKLGRGLHDGLYRNVWHRHACIQTLAVRGTAAWGERVRRMADFLESFSARLGDPFGSAGGEVREGLGAIPQ